MYIYFERQVFKEPTPHKEYSYIGYILKSDLNLRDINNCNVTG